LKAIVKVDSKGRVTIPLYIREALGLEPDSYVELELNESSKEIKLRPISRSNELLADLTVELNSVNDIHSLIDRIVREGTDIKLLRCRSVEGSNEYLCTVTIGIIDYSLLEVIKEALSTINLRIKEIGIKK